MGLQYRQYTTCVKADDYLNRDKYVVVVIEAALISGPIAALVLLGRNHPLCALYVILIFAIQLVVAYCLYDLNGRLICLEGDQTAVGLLISVETPAEKSGFDRWDTDTSVNLLLAKNQLDTSRPLVESSVPYGRLVAEHELTNARGLPFTSATAALEVDGIRSTVLHAEFEGAGVFDLFLGAQIAFALAVLALIACLTLPPWVAAILAILAGLALLIGALIGLFDSSGVPGDVNPELPVLRKGVHILFIAGTWVYDAGHNHATEPGGWNEIHPIKYCTLLSTWDGDWPRNIDQLIAENLDQYEKTRSPQTRIEQEKPENQWAVHPLIDGCTLSSIS